ncbi:hypothetical protein B296_00001961, partial [Ensete ventricosum]
TVFLLLLTWAGYIEPVMVILHEKEPTWAGRITWKHHTCMISALSISTTLKQHPTIWSASNIPHDAYKLLAVPSPIGGVLVICANTIHYHSQVIHSLFKKFCCSVFYLYFASTCFSSWFGDLQSATCSLALNSFATQPEIRVVQRLELMKSKASVLTSILFCYGSNSILQVADTEGDLHLAKRLRRTPSDALQEFASGEELSLYTTTPDSSETAQVCCSGHGKNGALCVLQQSIRPELITEVNSGFPFRLYRPVQAVCTGPIGYRFAECPLSGGTIEIGVSPHWNEATRRRIVLETADDLGEVTETVDYYVQGSTIAAGNLFGR